jgi:hypothetical protein
MTLAGLLLAAAGPSARAAFKDGLLVNRTPYRMEVKPMVGAIGDYLFFLTPTDPDGVRPRGGSLPGTKGLIEMIPLSSDLLTDGAVRFKSDHPKGSNVSLSFRVLGPLVDGKPLFQFKILVGCNKTGAETRSFISMDEHPFAIQQLPFDVSYSQAEPHKLVLVPKGTPGQAGAEVETKDTPADPSQIPVDVPQAEAPTGCCVIL